MEILRAIIKKELLSHLLSFRFVVSSSILLLLSLLAARVGTEDYRDRYASYQDQLALHAEDLETTTVYSFLQPVAVRAPEKLSVLDRGFDTRLGTEVKLNIFELPTVAADDPVGSQRVTSLRDLSLDLTTIVTVILGLLAFLLTFDAVCGERENGTLRLILANDVAPMTILAGKFFGALAALLLPLVVSLLISVWVLAGWGELLLEPEQWQRLAGLLVAYVVYLCVMLMAGLFISVAARRPSTALAASLLTWLLSVFLIPQMAVAMASQPALGGSNGLGDELELLAAQRNERLQAPWAEAEAASGPVSLERSVHRAARFRFSTAEHYQKLVAYYQLETDLGLEYAERMFAVRSAAEQSTRALENLARLVSHLSPPFLLTRLSESLTGTSVVDHETFLAASRAQRRELVDYFERQRAFDSWRWFTDDDPQALRPMPSLYAASDLSLGEFELWVHDQNKRLDRERKLGLDGLPQLRTEVLSLSEAAWRVRYEWFSLGLLGSLLAGVAARRFNTYLPR